MKLLNYILIGLILIASGIIAWMYFNPKIKEVYVQVKPKPEIVYVTRPDSTVLAKTTVQRVEIEKEINADSLMHKWGSLVDDAKKAAELTMITGTLEAKLQKVEGEKLALLQENQKLKNNVSVWEGKYYQFVADNETGEGKLKADVAIKLVGKNLDRYGHNIEISATSDNPDFMINGMEVYRQNYEVPKRFSTLVADVSLHKFDFNKQFDNIMLQAILKWKFNPDGTFRPYLFFGGNTAFDGNVYPDYGIGSEIKIK